MKPSDALALHKEAIRQIVFENDATNPRERERMASAGLEDDIEMTQEDVGFVAHCPNPDVASDGRTPKEALVNLREALELYFEDADRGADTI